MANNLMNPGKLLNEQGNIREPGYAFKLNQEYSREQIKASKRRIKEWDYYYFGDENYGFGLTIDDNGYMGLCGISEFDFKKKTNFNKSFIYWFCFGKVGLPNTSKMGNVRKNGKNFDFSYENNDGKRKITVEIKKYKEGKDLYICVDLSETTDKSMVIATPFNKDKHFYYNQKINLLKVSGYFKFGDFKYDFSDRTYGVLDWGRGVWTRKNEWYWSSMSGESNGHRIGFNLGYGFGDTSAASENMVFFDNEAYKLDDVDFGIPKDEKGRDLFDNCWHFTSKNGNIDLHFTPVIHRYENTDVGLIAQKTHQVFGKFSGKINVDNKEIVIENMLGFAEKVKSRW